MLRRSLWRFTRCTAAWVVIAGAAAACGSGGGGGFAPDGAGGVAATGGGGDGGTAGGAGAGAGGGATDAGSDSAADAMGDDAAPVDPAHACDLNLDVTPVTCAFAQAQIAPTLGGEIPEGIYDRTTVVSPLPPSGTCDSRSSLLLSGGVYKLQFDALGGPMISGGQYNFDSSTGQLFLTAHCGDYSPGYFYEYIAAEKKLTLFPDSYTGWVYVLRE